MENLKDSSNTASAFFNDRYTTFSRIPKTFLWQHWANKVPTFFSASEIESIESQDSEAVRKLTEFGTGRNPSSAVPPACHEKVVMTMALQKMEKIMNGRLSAAWLGAAVNSTGVINWAAVYKIEGSGIESSLLHTIGQRKAHQGATISATARVEHNWSNTTAKLELGVADFKPVKLFDGLDGIAATTNVAFQQVVAEVAGAPRSRPRPMLSQKMSPQRAAPGRAEVRRQAPPSCIGFRWD